jgi:hypothetical protein
MQKGQDGVTSEVEILADRWYIVPALDNEARRGYPTEIATKRNHTPRIRQVLLGYPTGSTISNINAIFEKSLDHMARDLEIRVGAP